LLIEKFSSTFHTEYPIHLRIKTKPSAEGVTTRHNFRVERGDAPSGDQKQAYTILNIASLLYAKDIYKTKF